MDCKVNWRTAPRRRRCGGNQARSERQIRKDWRLPIHLVIVGLGILAFSPIPAESAELVMFEAPFCEWCEVWDEEVGVIYDKTGEGRRAPLRRISIHGPRPADLAPIDGVRYSPTFVLLDEGQEVGRIVGYPGEAHFWGLLEALLDELSPSSAAEPMGDM